MPDAQIIDGKAIAGKITDDLKRESAEFARANGRAPGLAVVLVGEDPASAIYVKNKGKTAEKVGFKSVQKTLPADTPEATLVEVISQLNSDPTIDGILVQLPLPKHIDEGKIINLIDPEKDVDGFHPVNVGRLGAGELEKALVPCTPAGSVILAKSVLGADLSGLHAVVIGRSNIVGKPVAQLLLAENCTVTITHSRTKNLPEIVRQADIVIAAVGRPEMVKGDWLKSDATVIDVGINRAPPRSGDSGQSKIVGDVDFESAIDRVRAITPVPGGVGPMTIALLMQNTMIAARRRQSRFR